MCTIISVLKGKDMNYSALKKLVKENVDVAKKIYVCNFLTCRIEKMEKANVSIVKNIFGKYVVTKWLDYEYGQYEVRRVFSNKDLAAEFAWQIL